MNSIRPRILVVENDDDDAFLIRQHIGSIAEIEFVCTANEAVDKLLSSEHENISYKIIVLDRRVPQENKDDPDHPFPEKGGEEKSSVDRRSHGYSSYLLVDLRQLGILPDGVPVIIFTSYPDFTDCLVCGQHGAAGYIAKFSNPASDTTGFQKLRMACEGILNGVPQADPVDIWYEQNAPDLIAKFNGRVIALLDDELVPASRRDGEVIGKKRVFAYDSYQSARTAILQDRDLRWCLPKLIPISSEK